MQIVSPSKVRDLDVFVDQFLTFHDHINSICKSTHFHLRVIVRIRHLLTFDATAQLNYALITTSIDFCNLIIYNLPNNKIERLQRIQIILTECNFDRIIINIILLTHMAVNNAAPEYLNKLSDLISVNDKSASRASFDTCSPSCKICAISFFERCMLLLYYGIRLI